MMEVNYKPSFIKEFDSLEKDLQNEVLEKINLFKNPKNHEQLKVHKLHGKMKDKFSFYVNYKFRIVFSFVSKKEVVLLAIGDHEIYK